MQATTTIAIFVRLFYSYSFRTRSLSVVQPVAAHPSIRGMSSSWVFLVFFSVNGPSPAEVVVCVSVAVTVAAMKSFIIRSSWVSGPIFGRDPIFCPYHLTNSLPVCSLISLARFLFRPRLVGCSTRGMLLRGQIHSCHGRCVI